MLNPLKTLIRRLRRGIPGRSAIEAQRQRTWCRDPLAHPALQQMSPTQLADLPFDPAEICGDVRQDLPK